MSVKTRSHQPILPAALPAEAGELMLAQYMGRKSIRICIGLLLGWRKNIDLPMRLLEGLYDSVIFQPASPAKNSLRVGVQRMPELNRSLPSQICDWLIVPIQNRTLMP